MQVEIYKEENTNIAIIRKDNKEYVIKSNISGELGKDIEKFHGITGSQCFKMFIYGEMKNPDSIYFKCFQ